MKIGLEKQSLVGVSCVCQYLVIQVFLVEERKALRYLSTWNKPAGTLVYAGLLFESYSLRRG